ncbi:TIGR02679 domain-containing protein, partial [Alicyclobacillus mali (ex Roth et al. 2021)]|uniref:TIGR02679 domain-containing protein n=1 Tax=Alicyclobacillus mali (ex Roth et al. 2021) TaxID=1123961 RepID=UPI001F5E22CF
MSDVKSFIRAALMKPGLKRLWEAVRAKYESLGRVGGNVVLIGATLDEQEAIGALLGINLFGETRIKVPLARLEAALLQSRFGLTLGDALAALFGEVATREDVRAERQRLESEFRAYLESTGGDLGRIGLVGAKRTVPPGEPGEERASRRTRRSERAG